MGFLMGPGRAGAATTAPSPAFSLPEFTDEETATTEAQRGTYDPMYILASVSKLALIKLREDYRTLKGDSFNLREFHDRVLSQGNSPIWVLRRLMLPPAAWNDLLGQ